MSNNVDDDGGNDNNQMQLGDSVAQQQPDHANQRQFRVFGLRVDKQLVNNCWQENENSIDFVHDKIVDDVYVLFLKDKRDVQYELLLYCWTTECYSGYTTALYGAMQLHRVGEWSAMTHRVKREYMDDGIWLDDDDYDEEEESKDSSDECMIDNVFFSFSHYGYDHYYPNGHAFVKVEEAFEPIATANPRVKDKRMVWIFHGASGTGKSHLAHRLNRADGFTAVYETDSAPTLPVDRLTETFIVVGNKYPAITVEAVRAHLYAPEDTEVVEVAFT